VSELVSRAPLREQVKELLIERILRGIYEPGDRIIETRIAQELGTSQAPIREALRELALLRLVESEPYRGTRVRAVSVEEMAEIYPVRAALEEVAGRAAATRLDGDVAELERELEIMRVASREGDYHAQVEHDVAFHRLIVEAAGNATLLAVWSSLGIQTRTFLTLVQTGIDPSELVEMHVPIIDALRQRDPELAGRVLRAHVERFGELMLRRES
jgi:DNA-binding GntR family transcriptional regulator